MFDNPWTDRRPGKPFPSHFEARVCWSKQTVSQCLNYLPPANSTYCPQIRSERVHTVVCTHNSNLRKAFKQPSPLQFQPHAHSSIIITFFTLASIIARHKQYTTESGPTLSTLWGPSRSSIAVLRLSKHRSPEQPRSPYNSDAVQQPTPCKRPHLILNWRLSALHASCINATHQSKQLRRNEWGC